jgi:hypothetical protein
VIGSTDPGAVVETIVAEIAAAAPA